MCRRVVAPARIGWRPSSGTVSLPMKLVDSDMNPPRRRSKRGRGRTQLAHAPEAIHASRGAGLALSATAFILPFLILLTACGTQPPQSVSSKGGPSDDVGGSSDCIPISLPAKAGPATNSIDLTQVGMIRLERDPTHERSSLGVVSVARERVILANPTDHSICVYDKKGQFIFSLKGDKDGILKAPHAAVMSDSGNELFVADTAQGIVVFGSDSQKKREIEVEHPLSLDGLPSGGLVALRFSALDDRLVLLNPEGGKREFFCRRTPAVPTSQDFRGILLAVHVDGDRDGNIYAVNDVDYVIRKFDDKANYLGDFQPQADPLYKGPPSIVDPDFRLRYKLDPDFRRQWLDSWSRIVKLVVVGDFVVICFTIPGQPGYRLHFFMLQGSPAALPVLSTNRLVADDASGNLYFADAEDPANTLLVYRLNTTVGAHGTP